ncbi:unnamed protein product [Vitrella brassicaformis CCMP3155]|uniref:K Homology domain-containing protein n=1 Tax=Vitrella brassicaformis (strain CCMP3155) TaxID=1169540 RepID=A0A0G4FD33_VITBC|nr:unnamed protein product [Vitrella brassicaformis CCMP3155]|eukprot:CEM11136.1 unnamed protein product [Vitrella brassicaformis CCMP3155]
MDSRSGSSSFRFLIPFADGHALAFAGGLIGRKGWHSKILAQYGCSVASTAQGVMVSIAGEARQIQKALDIIFPKLLEVSSYMHRSSRPVFVLLIPPPQVGRVLGKGGCVIRRICKMSDASIKITRGDDPHPTSSNQRCVQCRGSLQGIHSAFNGILEALTMTTAPATGGTAATTTSAVGGGGMVQGGLGGGGYGYSQQTRTHKVAGWGDSGYGGGFGYSQYGMSAGGGVGVCASDVHPIYSCDHTRSGQHAFANLKIPANIARVLEVAVQRFSYPYFTLSVYGATGDVFLARDLFHRWLNHMHTTPTPTPTPAPIAPPPPPIPPHRYTHTYTIGSGSSGTMMASQTLPPPTRNMTPMHKMPLVQHAAVGHGVGAGVGGGGTGSVVCRPPPPPPPGRGVYRYDPHSNRYALCYPHNTSTNTNTPHGQTCRPRIV